ncbi:MAG: type II toxin-antitoxin system Phd/YefM family antitoxin [Gammaproteobacteria bacterium]
MTAMTTVSARENFSDVINRTAYGKERIVLSRRGKDLVAVIPLEDLQLIEAIEDKLDLLDAEKSLKEAKRVGVVSLEAFKDKLTD